MENSRNPFFLFLNECRKDLDREGYSQTESARLAGEEWRQMTQKDKQPYVELAVINRNQTDEMTGAAPSRRRRRSRKGARKASSSTSSRRRRRSTSSARKSQVKGQKRRRSRSSKK
ncbi:protamine-like [Stomoxys calcitrans]|uniref:protamine-like n=1 Tax=Stomoxys calcitrans TaxID=35570 RepID=UPI0027E26694|nr:protamine-like [Stomoxys calcitrans]